MKKVGKSIYSEIHDEFKSVFRVFILSLDRSARWKYETSILLCFMCARQRQKNYPLPIPLIQHLLNFIIYL